MDIINLQNGVANEQNTPALCGANGIVCDKMNNFYITTSKGILLRPSNKYIATVLTTNDEIIIYVFESKIDPVVFVFIHNTENNSNKVKIIDYLGVELCPELVLYTTSSQPIIGAVEAKGDEQTITLEQNKGEGILLITSGFSELVSIVYKRPTFTDREHRLTKKIFYVLSNQTDTDAVGVAQKVYIPHAINIEQGKLHIVTFRPIADKRSIKNTAYHLISSETGSYDNFMFNKTTPGAAVDALLQLDYNEFVHYISYFYNRFLISTNKRMGILTNYGENSLYQSGIITNDTTYYGATHYGQPILYENLIVYPSNTGMRAQYPSLDMAGDKVLVHDFKINMLYNIIPTKLVHDKTNNIIYAWGNKGEVYSLCANTSGGSFFLSCAMYYEDPFFSCVHILSDGRMILRPKLVGGNSYLVKNSDEDGSGKELAHNWVTKIEIKSKNIDNRTIKCILYNTDSTTSVANQRYITGLWVNVRGVYHFFIKYGSGYDEYMCNNNILSMGAILVGSNYHVMPCSSELYDILPAPYKSFESARHGVELYVHYTDALGEKVYITDNLINIIEEGNCMFDYHELDKGTAYTGNINMDLSLPSSSAKISFHGASSNTKAKGFCYNFTITISREMQKNFKINLNGKAGAETDVNNKYTYSSYVFLESLTYNKNYVDIVFQPVKSKFDVNDCKIYFITSAIV